MENYTLPEWVQEKFVGGFPNDWRQTLEKVFQLVGSYRSSLVKTFTKYIYREFVSSVENDDKYKDEKDEIKKKVSGLFLLYDFLGLEKIASTQLFSGHFFKGFESQKIFCFLCIFKTKRFRIKAKKIRKFISVRVTKEFHPHNSQRIHQCENGKL